MESRKCFKISLITLLLLLVMATSNAAAQCNYQEDDPDCTCFNNSPCTGYCSWDPGEPGQFIQDIANNTVGTKESCGTTVCIAPDSCGYDGRCKTSGDLCDDSGKPYYQMSLGMNTEAGARAVSYIRSEGVDPDDPDHDPYYHDNPREEWCSETVSYWHREAGIPYRRGYSNDWHQNWQIKAVYDMRIWYVTEYLRNGRGRWIAGEDVSYENFILGVTLPVPGSYVAIHEFTYGPPARWINPASVHSLMVNEMWIHVDALGTVFQVEISLLEGNSGKEVKNVNSWTDILELTPQGDPTQFIGGSKKILGFGVDLDTDGQPIYDPARLHYLYFPGTVATPPTYPVNAENKAWDAFSQNLPLISAYALMLAKNGGVKVACSSDDVKASSIPDGFSHWAFPKTLSEDVEIKIDLLDEHPMGIKGLELRWEGSYLPNDYTVMFAGEDENYQNAQVPDLSNLNLPEAPIYPIPVRFTSNEAGVAVRYVKFFFPKNTFSENAILEEMRFSYVGSPWEDGEDVGADVYKVVHIDIKPGSCPNAFNVKEKGVLPAAIAGSADFDISQIDLASVRLEGVAPLRHAIEDVATPFGPLNGKEHCSDDCTTEEKDGYMDLNLKFEAQDIVAAVGDLTDGECRVLKLTGNLTDGTPILGEDVVLILKKGQK